jgi:hypothetical protein
MPELPSRPDLDQLRRQARELLRAAMVGEPTAITRIHAVSPQLTLSAAQLALAREYGFPGWPALRAEAEARRLRTIAEGPPPAEGADPGPPQAFGDRWSFGGAGGIETLTGLLHVEGLVAGPNRVTALGSARPVLFARLVPWTSALEAAASDRPVQGGDDGDLARERQVMQAVAQIGDIGIADDRGTPYILRRGGTSVPPGTPWIDFEFGIDPVPGPGTRWLEITGQNGTVTRLLPSASVAAQAGQVRPVTCNPAERDLARRARLMTAIWLGTPAGHRDTYAREAGAALLTRTEQARQAGTLEATSELPDQIARLCAALTGQAPDAGLTAAWAGILATADLLDGALHHVGIGLTVPPVEGVTIRLDALTCTRHGWRLHLRSAGRWPVEVRRDGNGNLKDKWLSMEVGAVDDRGNSYLGIMGAFSSGDGGIQQQSTEFRSRLDPLARRLALTITGPTEQVTIDLELGPVSVEPTRPLAATGFDERFFGAEQVGRGADCQGSRGAGDRGQVGVRGP